MNQTRKPRGVWTSESGLAQLRRAKAERRVTFAKIAIEANVGEKTVKRFFNGESVDPSYADSIVNALGLQPENIIISNSDVVRESIADLRRLNDYLKQSIDEKENEIELLRTQTSKATSELRRLEAEKAEMELLFHRSDQAINRLEEITQNFKIGMGFSHQAAEWLSKHKDDLIDSAVNFVLNQSPNATQSDDKIDLIDNKECLSNDLNKYLYLTYHCLMLGSDDLLHRAIIELEIPLNLNTVLYAESLKFIRDNKIPTTLPAGSIDQITYCLNFLITELQRFS